MHRFTCNSISVVLGANDTGKSRTLVAVHEALRRFGPGEGDAGGRAPLRMPDWQATLFVELSDEEAIATCTSSLSGLLSGDEDPSTWGRMGAVGLDGYDADWLADLAVEDALNRADAITTWLEVVRRSAGLSHERFDPLFRALAASRVAAVVAPLPLPMLSLALPAELAVATRCEPCLTRSTAT